MFNRDHIHEPQGLGATLADAVAALVGSWRFVIVQASIMLVWVLWNTVLPGWLHFDAAPFIGLNLILSTEAAFTASFVLMSQNRSSAKDRMRDDTEAREVEDLTAMNRQQLEILRQQDEILALLKAQARGDVAHVMRDASGRFRKRDAA